MSSRTIGSSENPEGGATVNAVSRISLKQKILLGFLLAITILSITTYFQHPWHPDHYTLGQYVNAVIEKGYAPWILHPASLFGYYPLSEPSGFEFFHAVLYNITGLGLDEQFFIFSVFSALFVIICLFILMREFSSFEISFLGSIILATMVYFVKNVSNNASSRMMNIIFYPLFILALFRIYTIYRERKSLSVKFIALASLLFLQMYLTHRLAQLLFIFVISLVAAISLPHLNGILQWIKSFPPFSYRKNLYDMAHLAFYLDLFVLPLMLYIFVSIKLTTVWLVFAGIVLLHFIWFDIINQKTRTNRNIVLDMVLIVAYAGLAKFADLFLRGRVTPNATRLFQEYLFQITLSAVIITLLGIIAGYFFIKKRDLVKSIWNSIRSKLQESLSNRQDRLISIILFGYWLLVVTRNFTGDNFRRFGLDHYTDSFLLSGESPWVIMVNFVFNLNNNLTILVYFSLIAAIFLFLKDNKTFFDYFLIFAIIGFSHFLLDWEYVRLYMLPLYAIIIALGMAISLNFMVVKIGQKRTFSIFIAIFILHLLAANIFIMRERLIPDLDKTDAADNLHLPENFFVAAGSYLSDKGDYSVHTSFSIDLDRKVAYYAKRIIAVLAQSTYTESQVYEIKKIPWNETWADFKRGVKITSLYRMIDPIYGGGYYYGKHIYNLNKRKFTDENVIRIMDLYNMRYLLDDPSADYEKTNFFKSVVNYDNKVYSSGELEIYDLRKGRV